MGDSSNDELCAPNDGVCLAAQSCPTLCEPMDYSLPGSSVHGDSPRQEYWSGLPCPAPGDLPNPGIDLGSSALQANSLLSEPRSLPLSHQGNHLPKTTVSHWSLGFQCTVLRGYEHSDHKQILNYLELIVLADRGL